MTKRPTRNSNPEDRILLPYRDWPLPDRRAWEEMFEKGDIFAGSGRAKHWAAATLQTNRQHYARFLGWCRRQADFDPGCAPVARVTPASVHAYAEHLIATLASCTAASALIGLKVVMKAMAPDEEWRWLMDLTNRVNTWAKPSIDRDALVLPIEEINRKARDELDRLLATPLRRRIERVAYRDALMVLFLTNCPIRLKNLAGLTIGQHLCFFGGRWNVRLAEHETKNRQRLNYRLSKMLNAYLAPYLDRVRPSFGPDPDCQLLWLGYEGGPLKAHSVYCRIVHITERLLGRPINPQLFRNCGATSLVEYAPEAARLAAPLLGHRYFQTTERYYIKATQLKAGRDVNAALAEIEKELSHD